MAVAILDVVPSVASNPSVRSGSPGSPGSSGSRRARAESAPAGRLRVELLTAAGFACVGLAAAGVVLPLLPTTPFVLLAATCFARSRPRFGAWLERHRWFGPAIADWREHRSVSRGTKRRAAIAVVLTMSISVALAPFPAIRIGLVIMTAGLLAVVMLLPTRPRPDAERSPVAS